VAQVKPKAYKMRTKPIVAVSTCVKDIGGFDYFCVNDKYINSLVRASGVVPVMLPPIGGELEIEEIMEMCDGIYLTGSVSNVEPHHYGGAPSEAGTLHDPMRDATTLPLIRAAIQYGVPLFAICRGYQEVNVALGGTLHQNVHKVDGMMDHREDRTKEPDVYYGLAHEVKLISGGKLQAIAGTDTIKVNSLHTQGVDRLSDELEIEALAPDGLIEAFHVKKAKAFAIGVQWHPEWKVMENEFSRALFTSFGDACRERAKKRSTT